MNSRVRTVRARLLLSACLRDCISVSDMAGGCSLLLASHLLAVHDGDVHAVRSELLTNMPLLRTICVHARGQWGDTDTDTTYDQLVAIVVRTNATP